MSKVILYSYNIALYGVSPLCAFWKFLINNKIVNWDHDIISMDFLSEMAA